ncbi:MAG TPA: hypothetical protein VHK89_06195 [Actinomycetota bacterium]|nr:hypothetical protein [Actinomycetota bacterium]
MLDIFSHAGEEVEHVLAAAVEGDGSWARVALIGLVYVVGFGLGLLSLVYVARIGRRRSRGAIVYVVAELFNVGRRLSWETTLWGVAGGFVFAFITELVLEMAGG